MTFEPNYRTFVIANPVAAAGEVRRTWDRIERLLRARLPELDTAFTEGPGHATVLAREALQAGWEMVVCVGGDGTINEVVNGFYERSDPRRQYRLDGGWVEPTDVEPPRPINPDAVLGIIPLGTGGDFRRTVGLMGGLQHAVDRLVGRETRALDVGEIAFCTSEGGLESRYFLNVAGTGFSGAVDAIANDMWKGLGAKMSFSIASARAFVGWSNLEMEAIVGETVERSGPMFNFVVANGAYFGGGMWVAPGADLDDGQFQVIEMGDLSRLEIVELGAHLYRGSHLGLEGIERYHADNVAVRPARAGAHVPLDVDGEVPGRLPAHWRIHPSSIDLNI